MSLIDGTLEEAVNALAARSAELRSKAILSSEKRAASASDFLSSLGQSVKDSPALGTGLLGSGIGAGIGGLGALYGNAGKEKRNRKSVLGSMLTGGLAGGAVGGGLGLARHSLGQLGNGRSDDVMPAGQFADPATGKKMVIDAKSLKENPDLAGKVRALSSSKGPFANGLSGIAHNIGNAIPGVGLGIEALTGPSWLNEQLPFSSRALPQMAGLDALLHSSKANLGERIGWGRIDPGSVRGRLGEKSFRTGITEGGESAGVADAVRKAVTDDKRNTLTTDAYGDRSGASVTDKPETGRSVAEEAGRAGPDGRTPGATFWQRLKNKIMGVKRDSAETSMVTWDRPSYEMKQRAIDPNDNQLYNESTETHYKDPEPKNLTRGQHRDVNRRGYIANEAIDNPKAAPRGVMRNPLLGDRPFAGTGARVLGRVGGYGAIPLMEILSRQVSGEMDRESQLAALRKRFARPAE